MKQYILDAFTDRPFSGNPAAVCVMDSWPEDASMMALARENNLSETAFLVREKEGYRLRWFTPGTEVTLCGHATLASAFVVLTFYQKDAQSVTFHTLSGELTVKKKEKLLEMDFPAGSMEEIPVTDAMEKAFGARPARAFLGMDLVCVFDRESLVREMEPDQKLLSELPGRIQNATAPGDDTGADCVSRSFCPRLSIPEDPVCGSAHCQIAPYWAEVLGKETIRAFQASERGGFLECTVLDGGRIAIRGQAVPVAVCDLLAEL